MGDAYVLFCHDVHIVIIDPDAVSSQAAAIQYADFIHQGNRRLAVLLLDIFDFTFGFAEVDMDFCPQFPGLVDEFMEIIGRARIRRMRPHHDSNAAIGFAVPVEEELAVFIEAGLGIRPDADTAAAQAGADSRFFDGAGFLVHVIVHVSIRRRSATNHFSNAQHGLGINDIIRQFGFSRPDFLFQPVHELHIVSIAAEDRHSDMVMGIDEARQGQHPLAVNDFIVLSRLRHFGKARDARAVDGDILSF